MLSLVFVLLSISSIKIDFIYSYPRCPNGWITYNNYCYKLIRIFQTNYDAQITCSSMNAYLAIIDDQNKLKFIQSNFDSILQQVTVLWIGGSCNTPTTTIDTSECFWHKSTATINSWWCSGQPDNWQGNSTIRNEDAISLTNWGPGGSLCFNDANGYARLFFLCEIKNKN